jgi:3-isopropylmalate/(R)-2-methylmalate dehydratase small subunit
MIKGKVLKYKDNIDTDVIIPARYLNTSDPAELAKHCMEDIDKDFINKVQKGDIIAAGNNFGCGSSREHAPLSIKSSGISVVIAKSFARIFYKNALNIGLPIIEQPQASDEIKEGDILEVSLEEGWIKNNTQNKTYKFKAFPPFIQNLISKGGLISYTKTKLKK